MESKGEEGNSPQEGLCEPQTQPQLEVSNTTQINVHQTTETGDNDAPRSEESNEHVRPQETKTLRENIQEQTGQVPQNQTEENSRGTLENNIGNTANINLNGDQHNTTSNNPNLPQVPEYGSKNSQNYPQASTQQTINTPQHTSHHKFETNLARTHMDRSTNSAQWH